MICSTEEEVNKVLKIKKVPFYSIPEVFLMRFRICNMKRIMLRAKEKGSDAFIDGYFYPILSETLSMVLKRCRQFPDKKMRGER